jgi:hypothetical protein
VADVESLNAMIKRSARIQGVTAKAKFIAPMFYAFLGLVFAGFGYFREGGASSFAFIMGCGFVVYAAIIFMANRRAFAR